MKQLRYLPTFALIALASMKVSAAAFYWDADANPANNTSATGAGLGGPGSWDLTSPLWFNGSSDIAWTNANNDEAVFSGAGDTVTLAANIDAGAIYFTNVSGSYLVTNATGTESISLATGVIDTGGGSNVIAAILAGSQTIYKNGLGTLVLTATNSGLTGGIDVNAGYLLVGGFGSLGSGPIVATNGASLEFVTGGTFPNLLTLGDEGVTNAGDVINLSGSPIFSAAVTLTSTNILLDNVTGTFDFEGGVTAALTNSDLTFEGGGNFRISYTTTASALRLGAGSLIKNSAGDLNIEATTEIFSNMVLNGGTYSWGTKDPGLGTAPAAFDPNNITLNGGALHCSHTMTFNANRGIYLGLNGGRLSENTSSASATVPGAISGPGGVEINKGGANSSWKFTADNTYAGITTIDAGATLDIGGGGTTGSLGAGDTVDNGALVFNVEGMTYGGAISGTGVVTYNGGGVNIVTGAGSYAGATTMDCYMLLVDNTNGSGAGLGTLTVEEGFLGGSGIIGGPVIVAPGATLQPGDAFDNTPGVLTMTNSLTLQPGSGTILLIDTTVPTNSAIQGLSSVTYGGTLQVSLLNGDLTAGQTFKLFQAASYSGSFEGGVQLPFLSGNLVWDTNNLAVNGTITVSGLTGQFAAPVLSGANLILSGGSGPANGPYSVLATTNLALPLTDWTVLSTNNTFDGNGNFSFTNGVNPHTPAEFFLIRQP